MAKFNGIALILGWLSTILPSFAAMSYHVAPTQNRYDINPGETFNLTTTINPVPPGGLYSFGVKVEFPATSAAVITTADILVPQLLNFDGVREFPAYRAISDGTAAVKGTVAFSSDPVTPYIASELMTFRIADKGTRPFVLNLQPFNTLGITEQVFVDGSGNVLDGDITFGSAIVNWRPVVSIVAPHDSSVVGEGQSVEITAEAVDLFGSIDRVEFFQGNVSIGATNLPPYRISWNRPALGSYVLTARATDDMGAISTSAPVRVQIVAASPSLEMSSTPITLNRQTGLFEQNVEIRNSGSSSVGPLRILVRNLSAGETLYNSSGHTNGIPFVGYDQGLSPNASITLRLEYYSPSRMTPKPSLSVEASGPLTPPNPTGSVLNIDRRLRLSDGSFLIEFSSLSNRIYYIQYSSDALNWNTAIPFVKGNGSRLQWIDNGPPKTTSSPGSQLNRFYRAILVP